MKDEKQVRACEALAKGYRDLTGSPIVVGPSFMKDCRAIGMNTSNLLEKPI